MQQIASTNRLQPLQIRMAPPHWAPTAVTFPNPVSRRHPRASAANIFPTLPDWDGPVSVAPRTARSLTPVRLPLSRAAAAHTFPAAPRSGLLYYCMVHCTPCVAYWMESGRSARPACFSAFPNIVPCSEVAIFTMLTLPALSQINNSCPLTHHFRRYHFSRHSPVSVLKCIKTHLMKT
jgi:hypothetical protein